jgi:hypothetical protein
MSKSIMSDAGVGRALFTTRIGLSWQAMQMCFWFGALPLFVLPLCIWYFNSPTHDVGMVKIEILTHIVPDESYRVWKITNNKGERKVIEAIMTDGRAIRMFTPVEIKELESPNWRPVRVFYMVLLLSGILSAIGYFSIWYILKRAGVKNQENQRMGGANYVVSSRKLDALIKKQGASDYRLVEVSLPKDSLMTGLLALGSQGTGKSLEG